MSLVNYIYEILTLCWCILNSLIYLSDIINSIMSCSIYFDNIKRAAVSYRLAALAYSTWAIFSRILTIHSFCYQLCYSSFTCTSCTAKQICMSYSVMCYLIL